MPRAPLALPALLLPLILLPAASAAAQSAPAARPFGAPTRLAPTLREPLGLRPPPASPRDQLAPVPNRNIEAPRDRFANNNSATLQPLIMPQERRQGQTFGREHLSETGPDRPFDLLVPGARLVIPFEGNR